MRMRNIDECVAQAVADQTPARLTKLFVGLNQIEQKIDLILNILATKTTNLSVKCCPFCESRRLTVTRSIEKNMTDYVLCEDCGQDFWFSRRAE